MTQSSWFIILSLLIYCSCSTDKMYPNLKCQCGFITYTANYYSENLGEDGSIALFNDVCKSEKDECCFKRCVLYTMNILEKQTNPNFHSNASYVLSSEHIIKAHLQQAFTGSNIFKNYLVASVMAREISRLKSIVPATEDCMDPKWTQFLEHIDKLVVRNKPNLRNIFQYKFFKLYRKIETLIFQN